MDIASICGGRGVMHYRALGEPGPRRIITVQPPAPAVMPDPDKAPATPPPPQREPEKVPA